MLKWIWVSFVVIFIDQITKWEAEASLISEKGQFISYEVFEHLNFHLAYNYGAAFGMLAEQGGWQRWFFIILSSVVSVVLVIWLANINKSDRALAVGCSLILGGAVGNLIDRVLHGKVVDFIDVYADWDVFFLSKGADGMSHFATFNVADIAINLGAFILLITLIFFMDEDEPKPQKI